MEARGKWRVRVSEQGQEGEMRHLQVGTCNVRQEYEW